MFQQNVYINRRAELKKLLKSGIVILFSNNESPCNYPNNGYYPFRHPDPAEAKLMADTYAQVAREFIAAKMDMREPNVFEEARTPTAPVTPQKTRDIIIGFLLGALLAMAIVTIKFFGDDRICTTEDVAKVGNLPTLGLIPLQDMGQNSEQRKEKRIRKE